MRIEIPFSPEMAEAVLEHRKFCTSRNRKYGESDDWFPVRHEDREANFRLIAITRHSLWFVAVCFHVAEGFSDAKGFIDIWTRLHPKLGWTPEKKVWVHWFERMGAE